MCVEARTGEDGSVLYKSGHFLSDRGSFIPVNKKYYSYLSANGYHENNSRILLEKWQQEYERSSGLSLSGIPLAIIQNMVYEALRTVESGDYLDHHWLSEHRKRKKKRR